MPFCAQSMKIYTCLFQKGKKRCNKFYVVWGENILILIIELQWKTFPTKLKFLFYIKQNIFTTSSLVIRSFNRSIISASEKSTDWSENRLIVVESSDSFVTDSVEPCHEKSCIRFLKLFVFVSINRAQKEIVNYIFNFCKECFFWYDLDN